MKTNSPRFNSMSAKLKSFLVTSIKQGDDRQAIKHLNRLNRITSIRRERNLAAGMPGTSWIATTLAEVKISIQKKGL